MEENTENKCCTEENGKKCKCKAIKCVLTTLILLSSIGALCFSALVNYKMDILFKAVNIDVKAVKEKEKGDFLISEKYDKGQSLEKAQKNEKPVLTFFYANWCGYCKRFAPTFNELSKDKALKEVVSFAYVNCEDEKNAELVKSYDIQGFPTVFVIDGDKKTQIDNGILFGDKDALKTKITEVAK